MVPLFIKERISTALNANFDFDAKFGKPLPS